MSDLAIRACVLAGSHPSMWACGCGYRAPDPVDRVHAATVVDGLWSPLCNPGPGRTIETIGFADPVAELLDTPPDAS